MLHVLVTQDGFICGDAPVDAEGAVEDADASVCFGMVELVAFVLEDGCVCEDSEAVGKAFGNEEQMQYRWPLCEFYVNLNFKEVVRSTTLL